MEWNTALGEASAFGGDVMIRASALLEVGGYDEGLVAGEDPDLSFRIRRAGHRIVRLDEEMTVHDADMHRFSEFWRRQVRGGHAYAELLQLHGSLADRAHFRPVLSIIAWGGLLPALVLVSARHAPGLGLGLLALYPLLWLRIFRGKRREGNPGRHAALYASSCIAGKFASLQGVMLFVWTRFLRRKQSTLIEYKGAESPPSRDG
jgi:cellulose synthase/poly-beta-1,6-N-acetylglucosamine synthase-like glycosyltransferase